MRPRLGSDAALARSPLDWRINRLRVWIRDSWFSLLLPSSIAMDIRCVLDEVERLRAEARRHE